MLPPFQRPDVEEAYVRSGGPYFGFNDFCDNGLVKSLGGRYDPFEQLWYAPQNDVFIKLVGTGRWTPVDAVDPLRVIRIMESRARGRPDLSAAGGAILCSACQQIVYEQFLDCGCWWAGKPGLDVRWVRCADCAQIYRADGHQGACRCA